MGYGGMINTVIDPFGVTDPGAVKTPYPKATGKDFTKLITAFTSGMPGLLAMEQEWKPQFLKSSLDSSQQALTGNLGMLGGAMPQLAGLQSGANTAMRTADMGDWNNLGAGAMSAYRGINPQQSSLMDSLNSQAMEGLNAGNGLSPGQTRLAQQSARTGQAARGLGFGPSDMLGESLAVTQYGDQQQQLRQAFGTQVAGLNESYTSPVLGLLGGQSNAPGMGASLLGLSSGQASGAGPTLFPAYDAFNTAYNAQAAAQIATANNQAAADNSY